MVKRPDHTQKGTPHGVGVHVQDRHSGGGCDRKRGGKPTRDLAFTPLTILISFTAPPYSGYAEL